MSAKKLIVTDKQKKDIEKYVKKGLTGAKVAKKMKCSQSTMWRIMEEMGLNNITKKSKQQKDKIFSWKSFNGSVI